MSTLKSPKFNLRFSLRISALALVASTLMTAPLTMTHAQKLDLVETPKVGADGSVTMIIRKGHNVREIAKRYSRAHNIPFNKTLAGLLAANPDAFIKSNPDVLIIGAPFVLPSRTQLLGLQASSDNEAVKPETVTPTAGVPDEKKAVDATPTPAANPAALSPATPTAATNVNAVANAAVAVDAPSQNAKSSFDAALPLPIWLLCLMAIAMLMLLVRLFRKTTPEPILDIDDDKDQQSPDLSPPTVLVTLPKKSIETVEFESNSADDVQIKMVHLGEPVPSTVAAETSSVVALPSTIQPTFAHNTFGRVNLEAIAADSAVEAKTAVEVIHEAQHEKVAPLVNEVNPIETPTPKTESMAPLSKGLDLDVSGFMKRYANQMPPMRVQPSLDFEDLLDRTRLQAWLNQNTPEDVLLHAQDAHEERYGEVAEAMLADVLFRGDAEQCAMAVRLRKEWSNPRPL